MRFMLMVHHQEHEVAKLPPAEVERVVQEHVTFTEALKKAGVLVLDQGYRLRPGGEMTRLKVAPSKAGRAVFDGPHPETKEVIGSFYLIETATKEDAVEWAKRHPMWASDTVELRPLWGC